MGSKPLTGSNPSPYPLAKLEALNALLFNRQGTRQVISAGEHTVVKAQHPHAALFRLDLLIDREGAVLGEPFDHFRNDVALPNDHRHATLRDHVGEALLAGLGIGFPGVVAEQSVDGHVEAELIGKGSAVAWQRSGTAE